MKSVSLILLASALGLCLLPAAAQAPANAPPPPATPSAAPVTAEPASKTKSKPIPSFLILGTVFDERALSFPGAQVRIRQVGEKKYRWETYTNSRGEFAVRVPPGHDYEVWIHVKKYEDQHKTVDSKVDVQQRLSVRLEPLGAVQKGAKP